MQADGGRGRLVAVVVFLGVALLLGIIAVATGDGDASGLRVEYDPQARLTVYVDDPERNTSDEAEGASSVTVECSDAKGQRVASQQVQWPFVDTDGGTLDPHVHVNATSSDAVTRCQLKGTSLAGDRAVR